MAKEKLFKDIIEDERDNRFNFHYKILELTGMKANKDIANTLYNDVIDGKMNKDEAIQEYLNQVSKNDTAMNGIRAEMQNKASAAKEQEEHQSNNKTNRQR